MKNLCLLSLLALFWVPVAQAQTIETDCQPDGYGGVHCETREGGGPRLAPIPPIRTVDPALIFGRRQPPVAIQGNAFEEGWAREDARRRAEEEHELKMQIQQEQLNALRRQSQYEEEARQREWENIYRAKLATSKQSDNQRNLDALAEMVDNPSAAPAIAKVYGVPYTPEIAAVVQHPVIGPRTVQAFREAQSFGIDDEAQSAYVKARVQGIEPNAALAVAKSNR